MRRILFVIIIFSVYFPAVAQIHIRGAVTDSQNTGLEASVYVTDSSKHYVTHTKTGADGKFQLQLPVRGKYGFYVSSFGYESLDTLIYIGENPAPLHFKLHLKSENLNDIVIKVNQYEKIYKGDTVKYNLKAVRDGSEKNLKDLIGKIPGLEVNGNNIKANGKNIDYLLINGKNLFDRNKKIALDNIDAKDVSGIELYKNYKDPFSILPSDMPTGESALNIKLDKHLQNKITGKITVTPGVKRKYFLHDKTYFLSDDKIVFSTLQWANTGQEAMNLNDYLNLMLQSGETNLEIPPFLTDNNLQSAKISRFGSLHFVKEWANLSRIRAYLIFNSSNIFSRLENRRIFYDQHLGEFRERKTNASFNRFLTGFIHWEKKINDRFKTDLKFETNQWLQNSDGYGLLTLSGYSQKTNRDNISGNLQWTSDYRINPRAYLTYRLKLRRKNSPVNLQADLLPSQGFVTQKKNVKSFEWSQAFSLKLKPERHHYLNIHAGISGKRLQYNLHAKPDTVRDITNRSYVLHKKITANYTFRYKHWLLSPGVNYEFVTYFNEDYPRFDKAFFYPSLKMSVNNRLASLSFSFDRRIIPVSYDYWEGRSGFINYNTYYISHYKPEIFGAFSYWNVSIYSKRLYPGLYLFLSYGNTEEINSNKNYLSLYGNFYIKNIIAGLPEKRQSVYFISEKKFFKPGISTKFKYNHTQLKGFLYTPAGSMPVRSVINDFYAEMTYGRIKKPLKLSVTAGRKTTLRYFADTLLTVRDFSLESKAGYVKKRFETSVSFKYLSEKSTYTRRNEVFFDFDFLLRITPRLDFTLRSRDFFRLNPWQSTQVEMKENYTYVQSIYRMPGYILAGFTFSY